LDRGEAGCAVYGGLWIDRLNGNAMDPVSSHGAASMVLEQRKPPATAIFTARLGIKLYTE
ncbi:MAG: hypothetical protein AAGL18_10885, partial [Pseudomonadota bacterium]